MKSLRNRIDVILVSNKKVCLKWTSQPSYMSHKIFEHDLAAIHKEKVTLTIDKPVYIGMCILELSKVLIHEFHYHFIKTKYDSKSKPLFTDTDSLMYEIKTEGV